MRRTELVGKDLCTDLEFSPIASKFATQKEVTEIHLEKLEQKCDLGFCTPNQANMLNHTCTRKLHLNLKELHLKFLSEGQF